MIDRRILNEDGECIGHFTKCETWEEVEAEIQEATKRFKTGIIKCRRY